MTDRSLYKRLCLSCGFIVHSLHDKRPWPLRRRCEDCKARKQPWPNLTRGKR